MAKKFLVVDKEERSVTVKVDGCYDDQTVVTNIDVHIMEMEEIKDLLVYRTHTTEEHQVVCAKLEADLCLEHTYSLNGSSFYNTVKVTPFM